MKKLLAAVLAALTIAGLTTVGLAEDAAPIREITREEYAALYAENHSLSPEEALQLLEQAAGQYSPAVLRCVEVSGCAADLPFVVEYGAQGLLVEDSRGAAFLPGSWETFSAPAGLLPGYELSREQILLRTDAPDRVTVTYRGHAGADWQLPAAAAGLGWAGGRLLYRGTAAGRSGLFFPMSARLDAATLTGPGLMLGQNLRGVLTARPGALPR